MRVTVENYEPLKAFFAWMWDHILAIPETLPPEARPMAALAVLEARSMATARHGLGMAIGDCIEMTDGFSPEHLCAIDAALAAEGLWTLSDVKARFGRRVRAIMKRGSVRGESDYYALRNAVEAMREPERVEAWRLLAAFEARMGENRT